MTRLLLHCKQHHKSVKCLEKTSNRTLDKLSLTTRKKIVQKNTYGGYMTKFDDNFCNSL